MKTFYNFRLLKPGKKLNILIKQNDEKGLLLIARQTGKRVDLTSKKSTSLKGNYTISKKNYTGGMTTVGIQVAF